VISQAQDRTGSAVQTDEAADLASKAAQCRRLAAGISDRQAAEVLRNMAQKYEESARLKSR
jgi:hypothetical protein